MDDFLSEVKQNLEKLSSFRRVHVVLGNESCDLDSAVSAVTYAFYLHTKYQREATPDVLSRETTLTVPVLNICESQYRLRTETTHFFQKQNIHASHLIFKDQIDLDCVYNEDRLVITQVDHNVLTGEFARYEDKVIEVIDHRPQERQQDNRVRVKLDLVGSCSTLVAEELLDDPDFHLDTTIAELLYGTILVDTINRSPDAGKITERDENVLLCLEEAIPGVEGDKLFDELQTAKFDISGLLNMEILEKDLKRVAGTAMTIAMSSVTMDMQELINRSNFKEDLDNFCVQEKCEVVVIMTLVNDDDGKPTRQIAVYSENRIFRDQIADTLDNSIDIDLDLEMVRPPFDEISVFEQGNVKASRKKVMPILKSFLVGDTTPDVASKDFVSVHTVSVPTDGLASVIEVLDTSEVHFTLDSIDELSGRKSFENNDDEPEVDKQEVNKHEVDLLGLNSLVDVSDVNNSNTKILDFDPLATISSLDEESPPKDIPDNSFFGNTQNPFSDHGNTNTNKFTQNAKETSATFSSANLSSAHSSNVFDLGISDSELVDPFSSVEETGSQVYPDRSPKEIKLSESGENDTKDADIVNNNPFNIEVTMENNGEVAQSLNPFQDISEPTDSNLVNFQFNGEDDENDDESKGDNSNYIMASKTNPFSSGTFLEVDAYKSEHLLAYKSPSLIVECDEKSQADDLADLEESELFDKIPTPEIELSGESSPFVMSETGTPYEASGEYHPRTTSESSMLGMTVPPNSLRDVGFDDMDRRLPSFNNAEMVERINRKKALLGDLISTEEIEEENADVNIPYTPANSFRDNSLENIMRENSLPNLLDDSEMLEKVLQKRDSLQANLDFTEPPDTQTNPFESNPFRSSNFVENSSSLGATLTSNGNPFFQLDDGGIFGNQPEGGVTSLEQTDSRDVFNIFGDTGESTNTSLDNQVGSKAGSLDLCDITDFVTQSTQSGTQSGTDFVTQSTQTGTQSGTQSANPFTDADIFSVNDNASNTSHQTVSETFNSKCDTNPPNIENQSIIDVINTSANVAAVDAVSESFAREIIHDAIETYPDLKNPAVAEGVFSNADQEGVPFWSQQGSGDSGIGSTDSPQQVPKGKLQSHPLNSEVSVETEYLPGMDPLHGSLNIVTSPSQSHSIETDAGKEVVEGESFRKVSEAFLLGDSSFILNQTSTSHPQRQELPEQIREMIINKNIDTTAENIQSSTSVHRVVSLDEDKVISLDDNNTDLTNFTDTGAPLIAIPNDDNTLDKTADHIDNSLDISKESSTTEISKGAVVDLLGADDNMSQEVPEADLLGDFLENRPVDEEVVDTQEEIKISNDSMDVNKDTINANEDNEMNSDLTNYTEPGAPEIAISNDDEALVTSTIMSSGSDNSISSDASSSYQSSSESELVTVRENTDKHECVSRVMFNDQLEETHSEISNRMDTESLENNVSKDTNEVLISKEEEENFFEVADKLVKETFIQVLEQEKSRIIKGGETVAADNHDGDGTLEENFDTYHQGDGNLDTYHQGENLETSDNADIGMPDSYDELSEVDKVDKQFIVDKSDIVADQTPVLINSMMTESGLTVDSVSPVETPSEEHASGFYEVNPEHKMESSLSDSSYRTNLGENETGFYDLTNDAVDDVEGSFDSSKNLIGMNIRSYEDNAMKLDTVINNNESNKNFLMLDEDYSDASVSPLETPETEHAQGFYDINADNLELAIAKSESLNVHSSVMADSIYSDSSMSPLDTPDTETVGGFYDLSAEVMQKNGDSIVAKEYSVVAKEDSMVSMEDSMVAKDDSVVASDDSVVARKQLGPDDAPEINIMLVDSPESSKDSFDSETESCFEEKAEIKQEDVTGDKKVNVTTNNRSVRFAESTKFPEEMVTSTETVESPESENEGLYELNAELEGDLLQNIDVGNPFSPIESPNEEVFAMNYAINPCLPDPTVQNDVVENNDKNAESLDDGGDADENDKVDKMADFLVETALNEAISTLHDERSVSVNSQQKAVSFNDNMADLDNNAVKENEVDLANIADRKEHADLAKNVDLEENADLNVNADLDNVVELENNLNIDDNSDSDNNADEIEKEEPYVAKVEASLYNVADQLVEEAMTSAVEIVQDMNLKSESFRDPMTGDVGGDSFRGLHPVSDSDSDDSDASSTTTEGSYRIDHSSDLLTPDRDGVIVTDIDVSSGSAVDANVNNVEQNIEAQADGMTVTDTDGTKVVNDTNNVRQNIEAAADEFNTVEPKDNEKLVELSDSRKVDVMENDDLNNVEQNINEKLDISSDNNFNEDLISDNTRQVEVVENFKQQTEYVELFAEENKENVNVETEKHLEEVNEKHEFKASLRDANVDTTENEASFNLNDENGNITDEILEHDVSLDFDLDEDTSRFDEDTNTSIDVKSPDGPSYYKYDSFELDDKDVTEKSKTLNRQGTIIPDIIISMDDSPPIVDETVKCRRLGNYKPEIIDLSHETEDEVSEKDESAESDNVSEASVDTPLVTIAREEVAKETETPQVTTEMQEVTTDTQQEVLDKHVEGTFKVSSEKVNDSEKDFDTADQEEKNILESLENVKYHNIKDLESEKQTKKGAKKIKGENSVESTVTMVTDKKAHGGQDEYVTRKEIFYTSAGRLSISIDSVVDPPDESEPEADDTLQTQKKPVDDEDDLPVEQTEHTENTEKQNDQQKITPLNQEKMKVMEETEEWHEDPIPGMGVGVAQVGGAQESSTEESDTESDSEYTKPARPDTLLNGARKKKKIAATKNLLTPDSTDDLVEGVDNIPTPDDLETPSDLDGELEWEDDTPITPVSDTKKFVEYRDDEAEREKYENTKFRKVEIAGKDYRVDMKVIEPYKKVLSHGGYYGDGLNAIILFCGCYLPDRGRRDYQYVMDNLFLYVISTLELLVAEDYMIVYFHGATPRRQMPSFSWLKRCYQMIDRRLRKNLKGLLMVHPTLWLKTVVVMTKPFISSKFSSKLRFVKTLKELGKIVPMDYIYVPEPVSQYDDKLYQHRPCTSTPVTPSSSS